jgi:hypothetical protein
MTDQQPEHQPEVLETTEAQGEQLEQVEPHQPDDEQVRALRAEARNYRQKASAAKQEVERAHGIAEAYVRRAVEAMVADKITRPALLWQMGGTTPMELIGEDGEIDAERLEAAVAATVEAVPEVKPQPHHGDMGPRRTTTPRPARQFGDVLKGSGR